MGLFDVLLGGTETEPLWNEGQQKLAGQIQQNTYEGILGGVDPYTGQIAPGATANQQAAFQGAGGLLGGLPGQVNVQPAINQMMSGQPAYQIDPATSQQFYQSAVVNPAQSRFQDTLQGIDHRYGARFGRAGSQLENAYRSGERMNTELAGIQGDLVYRDEMARRQAAENAMSRMGQGAQLGMAQNQLVGSEQRQNLGMLAGLGAAERGIQGQQNAEQYNKWQMAQPYNNPWYGLAQLALTPEPTTTTQQPGVLGGALQGAMAGGAAGGIPGAIGGGLGGGLLGGLGWI